MAKTAPRPVHRPLRAAPTPPAPPAKKRTIEKLMPTSVLRWEDPSLRVRGGQGRWWDGVLDELRKNKGRWGLVLLVSDVKKAIARRGAAVKKLGDQGFEFAARPMPDGKGGVYACFKGEKAQA